MHSWMIQTVSIFWRYIWPMNLMQPNDLCLTASIFFFQLVSIRLKWIKAEFSFDLVKTSLDLGEY